MARPVARLGDRTIGKCSHSDHNHPKTVGGKIITASGDTLANNRGVARLNDKVLTDCGHVSRIITGSTDTLTNNRSTARINDKVGNGPYRAKIITGSTDTFVN